MNKAPTCKLCHARHWLNQPHQYDKVGELTGIPIYVDYDLPENTGAIVSRETFDWDQREREIGLRK